MARWDYENLELRKAWVKEAGISNDAINYSWSQLSLNEQKALRKVVKY